MQLVGLSYCFCWDYEGICLNTITQTHKEGTRHGVEDDSLRDGKRDDKDHDDNRDDNDVGDRW